MNAVYKNYTALWNPSVCGIDTLFEFDERIKKYETVCNIVDGKDDAVIIDSGTRAYRESGNNIILQD